MSEYEGTMVDAVDMVTNDAKGVEGFEWYLARKVIDDQGRTLWYHYLGRGEKPQAGDLIRPDADGFWRKR